MIRIENLTKSYRTPAGRHYVFKNINLDIPSGKNVALIGRNGAGKSTLLRMIGGIDRPDSGKIITDKTISWPVGLSGGFQGSLTGRENVKFVSRIHVNEEQVKEKVLFVEKFSELGSYFEMPIKTYSSGMRSRLGFGLSMAFHFDYYIIDEITAVGDARFRKKCQEKLNNVNPYSNIIMVSHSEATLKKFCSSAILIGKEQKVNYFSDIEEAIYQHNEMQK